MFPLKQRQLIRGAAAHVAAGLGVAADYVASTGTPYFAPFSGALSIPYGPNGQGGIWLRLTRPDGVKIEVAHLQKYVKSSGTVSEGELIAYTDNTGKLTSGPHAHIQIFDKNNNRVDPEKFNWLSEESMNPMDTKIKDIPEVEFNKLHDICNAQYPGWTIEMYNKNGRNAFREYLGVPGLVTMRDLWNYMENKPAFIEMRKNLQQGSSVDKSAIKDHANQIIKLVS